MNDTELDQILDIWEAPAPPQSLGERIRTQFPRAAPRRSLRPLRWALLAAAVSVTLAVAVEQTDAPWNLGIVRAINQVYDDFLQGLEGWRATSIMARVRDSDPRLYVDGQLTGSLKFGPAATINVTVPGDGIYSVISYRAAPAGWVEAGRVHGKVLEFRAGTRQIRIECNQPIVAGERPLFALRRQR